MYLRLQNILFETNSPGKRLAGSARRLFATIGTLKRFGALEVASLTPVSDATDPEPYLGTPASANTTAMPTEMDVDAAEPSAGGNVGTFGNDSNVESSLISSLSDVDERRDVSTMEPEIDSPNKTTAPDVRTHCCFVEMEPEDTFAKARNRLTGTEREHIDKRMEKVYSSTNQSTDDYPGTSNGKGKGIDPWNWGGIALEGPEMDALIQHDMLEEFNALHDLGNQLQTQNPEPNTLRSHSQIPYPQVSYPQIQSEEVAQPQYWLQDSYLHENYQDQSFATVEVYFGS
ncbi:hypothetical protein C0995_014209 [Termitomyces sp. Mi166|nr:hypothetical protein C0995_014209 [Termitomyces sp. Mi166\